MSERFAVVPQCPQCKEYDVCILLNKKSNMTKIKDTGCSCGGFMILCHCGEEFKFCNGVLQRSWGMGCPQTNGIQVSESYCKQFM